MMLVEPSGRGVDSVDDDRAAASSPDHIERSIERFTQQVAPVPLAVEVSRKSETREEDRREPVC